MRILLSNDDGIHAPGIQTLAKGLREFADVQVVAPDRNRSGASNSLTLESSLRTFTFENGDIAVQMGTPTDCVFLGVNALMRPRPDIVVSGINAGPTSAMTSSIPAPWRPRWKAAIWGSRRWRSR
jgi:5'-nucleotidase